jgi:hypothetical protein
MSVRSRGNVKKMSAVKASCVCVSMLPRKRKANNLAQSLGRVAHVKSNTISWLRTFDKQSARDDAHSVHMFTVPPSHTLPRLFPGDAQAHISAPLNFCPTPDQPRLPVQVSCAFCKRVLTAAAGHTSGAGALVHHNPVLPVPYVVCCELCSKNTRESNNER